MEVRGAAELRVKESDRISQLAQGLRAIGASVEEYPDGFRIEARPLIGRHGGFRRRSSAGHGLCHRRDRAHPGRPRLPAPAPSMFPILAFSKNCSG